MIQSRRKEGRLNVLPWKSADAIQGRVSAERDEVTLVSTVTGFEDEIPTEVIDTTLIANVRVMLVAPRARS